MEKQPKHAWRYDAKCKGVDTEIFYPPRDKALYKPIADKAKDLCFGRDGDDECPVRRDCLAYAIETDEAHGIFGGLSHRERNALVRRWQRDEDYKETALREYLWAY